MKKRLLVLACTLGLVFGMTMNVSAEVSPSGTKDTTQTTTKTETSPKTGESDVLLYGIAAAALLGGTVAVSKKRLDIME